MKPPHSLGLASCLLTAIVAAQTPGAIPPPTKPPTVVVHAVSDLRAAVAAARPGAVIQLAAGDYAGGLYLENVHGAAGQPIVIEAADPPHPPHFIGGAEFMHLSRVSYVTLRNLTGTGATENGINIDDGGVYDKPSHHVVLDGLKLTDVGPHGNHDALKLSGLDDFRVEHCDIERWGTGDGSGIDMVGCHRGVIEGNSFRHLPGDETVTGGNAVQTKGGCRDIAIRRNRFENAGERTLNIGGSTGLEFFRPPLKSWPPNEPRYEAKAITVEGNTFTGSNAPWAFVGVDGAVVRYNTVYRPRRWALRILQETRAPGFAPCRNGVVTDNIIVFRSDEWFEGGVNIGPGTDPKSFRFARNFWYCLDAAQRSHPTLPTREEGGVYGQDPLFQDAEKGDFSLKPGSPAKRTGAGAMPAVN